MCFKRLPLLNYRFSVFGFNVNNRELADEHICRTDFFAACVINLGGKHTFKIGFYRCVAVAGIDYFFTVYVPFIKKLLIAVLCFYSYRHADLRIFLTEKYAFRVLFIFFAFECGE